MIELLLQAERALSVGLLDRAETLYAQVAAADPRNSIAVVGLARVALDRGNEDEALALGRRALEIDPENDAAQRLVQRLEEVRAYRGEAAEAPSPILPTSPLPAPSPIPRSVGPATEPVAEVRPEAPTEPEVPVGPMVPPKLEAPAVPVVPPKPEPSIAPLAAEPVVSPKPRPEAPNRRRTWLNRLLGRNR
jgi:hypothetical protein